MPFQATLLLVFVASPGDMSDERSVVVEQINRWNRDHAVQQRIAFVPVAWEWAVAAQGGGGQHQINEQQVRSADVVIAMFWSRLGKATAAHPSGTAEEISIGIEQGAHVGVLISQKPSPPGTFTGDEYTRLQEYLAELQQGGLTQNFGSNTDLRSSVDRILWKAASSTDSAPPAAPPAVVDLSLNHWQGDTYAVVNSGSGTAYDVQLSGHQTLSGPTVVDGGPDLEPGDELLFMAGVSLNTESTAITLTWMPAPGAPETDRHRRTRLLPPRPPR